MISEIFKEGGTFMDKSVSSFTNIAGEARQHGNVILQAVNKNGVSVKAFSYYSGESEVLIPKGIKYTIKSVVQEKNQFGRIITKVFMAEV